MVVETNIVPGFQGVRPVLHLRARQIPRQETTHHPEGIRPAEESELLLAVPGQLRKRLDGGVKGPPDLNHVENELSAITRQSRTPP